MPQREFWTHRHPSELRLRYWIDLAKVGDHGMFDLEVFDQSWKRMELASVRLPGGDPMQLLSQLAYAAIHEYLYGEGGRQQQVLTDVRKAYDTAIRVAGRQALS